MTDESTLNQGGSEALPETTDATAKAPRNDAEAALQQSGTTPTEDAAQAQEREAAERKKNRTRDYIDRQRRQIAELAEENARLKNTGTTAEKDRGSQAGAGDKEPTLEDHDWDMGAFNRAHAKWAVDQALKERDQSTKQAEDGRKQREMLDAYNKRAEAFIDDHPDFSEAVGSIPYQLSTEVQAAIMAHERGPEIAYHLANNDDDAFSLSNVLPHVAAAAVERLVKRLTDAPAKSETNEPNAALKATQASTAQKPISKAPPPTATVSGRSPTDTPSEKLTDDEWYRRDVERRRKR